MELIESAACNLMLAKAILNASPNSPSLMALSASVNPPIAFDAPVRISPSFMPAPAASNRVNRSVASSNAGAICVNSPAANSRNLPFATFILSEILSNAFALKSITNGMLPSWSLAVCISPLKSASSGRSSPPALPKMLIASADRSPSSVISLNFSASIAICSVGVLPAMSAIVSPRRVRTVLFFSLPCAASSMNFWSLLIEVPTLSAPTPLLSNARLSNMRLPAVSPVRALRSFIVPPRSSASLKVENVPAIASPTILIAPNPTASAAPALSIEPKDVFTPSLVFLTSSSMSPNSSLTLRSVSVRLMSFAENFTSRLIII